MSVHYFLKVLLIISCLEYRYLLMILNNLVDSLILGVIYTIIGMHSRIVTRLDIILRVERTRITSMAYRLD